MSDAHTRTIENYLAVADQTAIGEIYKSLREAGILPALADGQKTAQQLADACQLKLQPLERLLDCLVPLGIIERYDEWIALSQTARLLLQYEDDFGSYRWQKLDQVLREGVADPEQGLATLRNTRMARQWASTAAALELIHVLGPNQVPEGTRLLDLGCGVGVWSVAIAHKVADLHITLVDDEASLLGARGTAESIGLTDRLEVIEGDYRELELPAAGFDIVVASELFSLEPADGQQRLLERIHRCLKPGGYLVLIDVFPGQPQADPGLQLYALELALASSHAGPCDPLALQELLTQQGFVDPRYAHLEVAPYLYGMIVAGRS
jgi:ubiquinone/menaquinone biosynthesis C-methylase UbiE